MGNWISVVNFSFPILPLWTIFGVLCVTSFFEKNGILKIIIKKIVFLFPLFFICYLVILKFNDERQYKSLVRFESTFEHIQAAVYFIAFLVSLCVSCSFWKEQRRRMSLIYFLLAGALLFISLEEISWGQKIISYKTFDYFKAENIQRENTLHNLSFVQPILHHLYIFVGFYGSFSRLFVPNNIKNQYKSTVDLFMPRALLFFYFFPTFVIYNIFVFGRKHDHRFMSREQEPAELLLSLGFLLFVVINYYHQKTQKLKRPFKK